MKYALANKALHSGLWDIEVIDGEYRYFQALGDTTRDEAGKLLRVAGRWTLPPSCTHV